MGSLVDIYSGHYYKYIEFQNSTFILSNDIYIQSDDEMCVVFWLGEQSQIVLTTDVVRYVHSVCIIIWVANLVWWSNHDHQQLSDACDGMNVH